ncbi:UvrD-helicase domain-containing protein [Clostridium sp. OS1-26]|uniref:UvrD-helicase domain-containing protein n=1 Tax=Clostridium sp. OS1-26 TaxID=3070681 RepID=UPI0027E0FDD2|nr:UvrD-helicase domain-containing protein [Clostridium sp. OS1-26]WML37245.1 AAA family ATPase [Clostridium sp. OS1-26]
MRYSEVKRKLFDNLFSEKSIIVSGKSGSGKTILAIEKYKHMVEEEKINSEDILVLVMNRHQAMTWKKEICLRTAGELKIYTYQNFVSRELTKFWPIIENKCSKIEKRSLRPEFISTDLANYMMELLVNYYRRKGYLLDITSHSSNIASDLVSNINKAAMALVDFKEIGTRLYNSLQIKESISRENYEHIDSIIEHYVNSFLKQGVVDYGIGTYLYNNYLVNDDTYTEKLNNIKYIIIDDFNEIPPVQLALINKLMCTVEKGYMFYNQDGGFCTYYGADKQYLMNNTDFCYHQLELEESFLCGKYFMEFSEEIGVDNLRSISAQNKKVPIYFDIASQLRSEMLEKISNKIKELIRNGKRPEDIVIISPSNDVVLSSEIEYNLRDFGIEIINTSKKSRLIDNPYVHSLIVIACLCNKYTGINLTKDDYKRFFSIVLDIDMVKASIISKSIINYGELQQLPSEIAERIGMDIENRYNNLKECIQQYRHYIEEKSMSLGELFRRGFLELLITLPRAKDNIQICKNLSETAEKFIDMLTQLNTKNNPEEKFIMFVKSEAADFSL